MILEHALLQVKDGLEAEFEAAMREALPLISGYTRLRPDRSEALYRDTRQVSAAGRVGDTGSSYARLPRVGPLSRVEAATASFL